MDVVKAECTALVQQMEQGKVDSSGHVSAVGLQYVFLCVVEQNRPSYLWHSETSLNRTPLVLKKKARFREINFLTREVLYMYSNYREQNLKTHLVYIREVPV